ncbi:hypothetical protein H6F43_00845, partial [Leptolyngbya sp. FACHB-36]
MSQDQPPPDPSTPEPTNDTPPETIDAPRAVSPLKTQTVRALRTTIRGLERLVERLEAEPDPGAAGSDFLPTLTSTANGVWEQLRTSWQRIQAWWTTVLARIR